MLESVVLTLGVILQPTTFKPDNDLVVRRFALVVAANNGGEDRAMLRYAETDARAFSLVLRTMGGVAREDEQVLVQPSVHTLRAALSALHPRLKQAQGSASRLEFVMYYSGHSDAEGLLLGPDHFNYSELKHSLAALPVDVRIAVLDACSSGAMTRQKGGRRRPPFVVDASNQVRGYAVLTSSSEDEAAQESDKIGASFFTHYLISGLRGAGDSSEDGRVTLSEAYDFAFHETLARTQHTLGGPQHPAYDIQLVGTGDVVMTDLRRTGAGLVIQEASYGRMFIRDRRGKLVTEVRKLAGRPMQLGLEPGEYTIAVEQDGVRYQGEVELIQGRKVPLSFAGFRRVEGESTTLRGTKKNPENRVIIPIDIGIAPGISINGFSSTVLNHVSLSLGMSYAYELEGVAMALGASWLDHTLHGIQLSVGFNHVASNASGVQFAVGFNNVGGSFSGLQSSVGFNIIDKGASATQLSVGMNIVQSHSTGLQGAVGLNLVSGDMKGLQGAVGLNLVSGDMKGLQGAVGLNLVTRDYSGVQMSSALNFVGGKMDGLQLGIANLVLEDVYGAQIGLINMSEAAGLQLGLVNVVSETDGVSLGLLNYALEDGILDLRLYTSDATITALAFEIGTRNIYTAFSIGYGAFAQPEVYMAGLHLGSRLYIGPDWEVGFEIGTLVTDFGERSEIDLLNSVRIGIGYRIAENLLVFLGPSLNVLVDLNESQEPREDLAPDYAYRPEDDRVYIWPGFWAGFQFF